MMNTLKKLTILVLLLFLAGCAHHSRYYSGRSGIGTVGIRVDNYNPYYQEYDVYLRRPVRYKYSTYKPYYDAHSYNDKHRHYKKNHKYDRSFNKHYSKRDYGKHKRGHEYERKGKREREYARHAFKHDSYRYR